METSTYKSFSKRTTEVESKAATSQSGRISGRIQGSEETQFFFKSHHQSSQELAEYAAGFYEIIPARILFKMAKIYQV